MQNLAGGYDSSFLLENGWWAEPYARWQIGGLIGANLFTLEAWNIVVS